MSVKSEGAMMATVSSTDNISKDSIPENWWSVCYGNGRYVAVSNGSDIASYSDDGINWTQSTLPSSKLWSSVCYGNNRFVAIAYNSNIVAYSDDGIVWKDIEIKTNI